MRYTKKRGWPKTSYYNGSGPVRKLLTGPLRIERGVLVTLFDRRILLYLAVAIGVPA